jgi:hypothetical protein
LTGESDFSFSSARCEHIVTENLQYRNRLAENENIVELFDSRQSNRKDSRDKSKNPLTSIPGSPGSGKSSFLSHFPESVEYKSYVIS